jgi:ATP-dependent Clp protease protease subunit
MYEFDADSGELFLYDAIGESVWGMIDAATVMKDLKSLGNRRATIRINSPGGSVDEGRAIYNAMKRHPGGVDTIIDSAAYSIAGYIAMAGERRLIAANGMLMVHNPWTLAFGNAAELRKTADVLDKYRDSVLDAYATASGKDRDEVMAAMDAETWYTSEEALASGYATEIGDAILADEQWHPMALAMRPVAKAKPEAGSRFQCSRPMRTMQFRK